MSNIQSMSAIRDKFFVTRGYYSLFTVANFIDSIQWREIPSLVNRRILVLSANSCGLWASGDEVISLSTNEGVSFRFIDFNFTTYKSVSITLTDKTAYANLFPTGIFRSDDCGTTWKKIPNTDSLALANAYEDGFLLAGVIISSSRVRYFRSKNNGTTWQEFTIPDSGFATSFLRYGNSFYVRSINIFSQTSQNQVSNVYRSDDSCKTWQKDSEGLPTSRASSLILFQNALYVGTEQGMYRADLTTTSVQEKTEKTKEIYLYQNTPNPFSQTTTISFDLAEDSNLKLTVHNAIGQEILVLADGRFTKGTHTIPLNANSLVSGIYTYRLQMPHTTLTNKMILMR